MSRYTFAAIGSRSSNSSRKGDVGMKLLTTFMPGAEKGPISMGKASRDS